MPLDFWFLLPEIAILFVVSTLALFEMFEPAHSRRLATRLNLGGALVVGLSLALSGIRFGKAFDGIFSSDPFSLFFKFLFLGSAVCVLLMKKETEPPGGEFYLLLWSALLGMFCLVSAKDFLLFFISLELLTLSLYILAAYSRTSAGSVEAGLKYLVLGSLASAFLLYGISLIYAATGTLSFDTLGALLDEGKRPSWLFLTGLLLVLSALGFKVAAVPFQVWVPDVYQGAPTPVVAFLSVASKSAGFAALLRILLEALGNLEGERRVLFSLLATLTLFYGNLGALVQKDMKRLIGFSSIGHAGYLLIALASENGLAEYSLLYYLLAYAVTNLALFFVVVLVENSTPTRETGLEAFSGLFKRSPLLAATLFISLLSLAGVPPLAGFFSKFFVFWAAAKSRLAWLVILGAINVAISLYYYLSVVRIAYFEPPKQGSVIVLSLSARSLVFILIAAIVLVGVWQAPFFAAVSQAARSLF
jgi:NADH-quinone oxidoreductase subunit N